MFLLLNILLACSRYLLENRNTFSLLPAVSFQEQGQNSAREPISNWDPFNKRYFSTRDIFQQTNPNFKYSIPPPPFLKTPGQTHSQGNLDFNTVNIHWTEGMYFFIGMTWSTEITLSNILAAPKGVYGKYCPRDSISCYTSWGQYQEQILARKTFIMLQQWCN